MKQAELKKFRALLDQRDRLLADLEEANRRIALPDDDIPVERNPDNGLVVSIDGRNVLRDPRTNLIAGLE